MNTAEASQGLIHRATIMMRGLAIAGLMLVGAAVLTPTGASAQGREELIVPAGQSEVLDVGARYTDLMIADPEIADVLPLSDRSIYVVGKKPGTTALSIYGPGKRLLSVAMITVGANSSGLKQRLYEILPGETGISVTPSGDSLVLSGPVSSGARGGRRASSARRRPGRGRARPPGGRARPPWPRPSPRSGSPAGARAGRPGAPSARRRTSPRSAR